jgi:hypothetical protein
MGETLPLFESAGFAESEFGHPRPQSLKKHSAMGLVPTSQSDRQQKGGDRHMRVAWHLSNALKAGKAGRRSDGSKAKLTATQKRQVGNAICEHLLASLREQVSAENRPS